MREPNRPYVVALNRRAEKELRRLPDQIHKRVTNELLNLETNARPSGCKKLSDRNEYRIRVREYRVLYEVDDKKRRVEVFAIGHRKEVYR